ncbi:hypothetical protein [Rhizobium sp. CC-YZS058]|uniref:hypothetical protein n=1 Tax=Rhizobium sp. CC-YZS058 TaxID=3042153 RepID=UPI002B0596C6|nr:hypothetical protein [Rhizobium sp. CC-YZS058]MEA3534267.1 hypothetical protein [Rhizobium sp. CC-YZS058]
MTALIDDIERFADATTHAERADALLACRLSMLLKYESTILNRCHVSGFREGAQYVRLVLDWLRSPGALTKPIPMRLQAARGRLQQIASSEEVKVPQEGDSHAAV